MAKRAIHHDEREIESGETPDAALSSIIAGIRRGSVTPWRQSAAV